MTDTRLNQNSDDRKAASLGDDVGRLVRMAGPRAAMPPASVDRLRGDLRPLWQAEVDRRSPVRPRLAYFAAAAVLLATIATVFLVRPVLLEEPTKFARVARLAGTASVWRGPQSGAAESLEPGADLATGQSLATASAALVALETTTGHSLRLDRSTRIVVVGEREIRLEQGAVYIESLANGSVSVGSGLIVLTPFGRVEEIGTQFEVRLGSDSLTVRVREGEVEFGSGETTERAVAGEEITVSRGLVRRGATAAFDALFDWTARVTPFWPIDGRSLESFLEWAARQSGYRLEIAGSDLADEAAEVVLSGEIEGLTPKEALEVVLPAVGLTHRFEQGALVVSRLGTGTNSEAR